MVHLRIVVPSHQSEHTLDLLEDTPTVCNVIYLQGAARKPEGDVILCDVVREDASVLIADLRELEIDVEGSIAIEEIDSTISEAAVKAQKSTRDLGNDPVIWEEVTKSTNDNVELTNSFLLFMVLAMQIAAVGIFFDQPILIIGAMVVGPEFGPIAGICVAAVSKQADLAKRSARALAVGFPLGTLATIPTTLLLKALGLIPETIDFDNQSATRFISNPDFFSFYIALVAGVVGTLSLTTAKSSTLVGVLISVATIPAAANMGVAVVYGDLEALGGSALQLAINLTTIFAAGLLTLFIQRRLYVRRRRRHLDDESRTRAGLPHGSSRRRRVEPCDEPEAT